MKNSKIYYLYRDAANYKTFNDVVVSESVTLEELSPYFHDHQFFIPSEVGFDDLQPDTFTCDDHIWHELYEIETTEESPTVDFDSEELVKKFKYLSSLDWNETEVFKKKGLL